MEQKFYVTKDQVEISENSTQIKNDDLNKVFQNQGEEIAKYLSDTFSSVSLNEISLSSNGIITVNNEEFTKSFTKAIENEAFAPGNLLCGLGC